MIVNPFTEITLQPRSEHGVKVPTDLKNGQRILNFVKFCEDVTMPSVLVTCKSGIATTIIQNSRNKVTSLTKMSLFHVIKYDNNYSHSQLNYTNNNT